ncbi:MAG: iron transporter [Myxococcota bacterium]
MKRLTLIPTLLLLAACEDQPIPTEATELPSLEEEVVVIDATPIAGGAATLKFEIASLTEAWGIPPADVAAGTYHFEAQIRYAGPLLGGRNAGDFVPYLDVALTLTNVDTGDAFEAPLLPVVGIAEGWHYATDLDLGSDVGVSRAGYEVGLTVGPAQGVVLHEDLLDSTAGTFFGAAPIAVRGFFTLDDLAAPEAAEDEAPAAKPKPKKTPGGGYGY